MNENAQRIPPKTNNPTVPAYVGRTLDVFQHEDGSYIVRNKMTGKEYPVVHERAVAMIDAALCQGMEQVPGVKH